MSSKMKYTKGERLNIHFNSKIRLEFHGARLTSDGGLLAYRELDNAMSYFSVRLEGQVSLILLFLEKSSEC
jgi:hypothetical protein